MNEEWIDQLLAEPVDLDPRAGFRDELRERLAAEFDAPTVVAGSVVDSRPRWWMLGAVAASAAVLAGGLALSRSQTVIDASNGPTPTVPEAVADPSAISLDEWIDPVAEGPVDPAVAAIDRTTLPDGWSVSDENARLIVYPTDMTGYTYEAVVTTDGAAFAVTLTRDPVANDPCFATLMAGYEGTIGDLTGATPGEAVCGYTADSESLAVIPTAPSSTGSESSALDVANALRFVAVDEIPHRDLTLETGRDEPADVELHGTLSGARWAVAANRIRIDLYVGGTFSGGQGLSATDSAFPLQGSLVGVPGYGAIATGRLFGNAVSVTVTTDDGRTATLPLVSIEDWSLYAIPIPDTVDITTLTFLSADGSVVATADVPDIPPGYQSGMLGIMPRG